MTGYLIRAVGYANGRACWHADHWLESFDFNSGGGVGFGAFTKVLSKAKVFESKEAAFAFWRTASTVKPTRPDGKPNRPLTSLTIEIEPDPLGRIA